MSSINVTTCIQPIRNTLTHSSTQLEVWINVTATLISFYSVIDVLGRPDFGALATEPVASNLSLMRLIVRRVGGGVLNASTHAVRTRSAFSVFQYCFKIHFFCSILKFPATIHNTCKERNNYCIATFGPSCIYLSHVLLSEDSVTVLNILACLCRCCNSLRHATYFCPNFFFYNISKHNTTPIFKPFVRCFVSR